MKLTKVSKLGNVRKTDVVQELADTGSKLMVAGTYFDDRSSFLLTCPRLPVIAFHSLSHLISSSAQIQSTSLAINNPLHLLHILYRRRQILIPIIRYQYIIFNPHPTHSPVFVQDVLVDVLGVLWVLQVGIDYETAEVDLWYVRE